jgi:hypothetical protein
MAEMSLAIHCKTWGLLMKNALPAKNALLDEGRRNFGCSVHNGHHRCSSAIGYSRLIEHDHLETSHLFLQPF